MAYNSAYTGPQVDAAVGAVREKESAWDGKQNKLNGTEDQIVGFNAAGDAVPVAPPDTGVTTFNGRTGAVTPQEGDYTADMVGARPDTWTPSAADVGARPDTWTPSAADVGAMPAVSGGTTGQVLTKTESGQAWQNPPAGGITQDQADARYLRLSGGTMTGAIALPGNPTSDNQAANKAYVDALKPNRLTVTLSASGWSGNSQTVTVSGVSADETAQLIMPVPALASQTAYYEAGILVTGQAANSLTFTCQNVPTEDLTVYVVMQEVGA